jgi:hypothetical protein
MKIKGSNVYDEDGRSLLLRGCNLGGSTKVPVIENSGTVSFVGKPFPLEEAEERFAELRRWGLFFNRLVVPWETIEHEGPGIYDEAYLAYLRKLLLIAEKNGIYLWIDPHQDVWGRAAGGDGAPSWTLEALGMDISALEAAGAVLPRHITDVAPPGSRPLMTWPAGNNRYAAATMFTLFFAGNAFAPQVKPSSLYAGTDGLTMQDWLQTRFIEAYAHAKRRLKNCASIAGWGAMNEPHPGFIGYTNLNNLENNMVAVGPMPSPFAAMAAASGYTTEIPVYTTGVFGVKQKGKAVLNPDKVSVFRKGYTCPWKTAGIWRESESGPELLRPNHFAAYKGRALSFSGDFLFPFMDRFRQRLSETDQKSFFFIEGVPSGIGTGEDAARKESIAGKSQGRTIHAFHWYDGPTMFLKQFRSWFNFNTDTKKIVLGKKAVAALYKSQISGHILPDMPNMVGEFGLSFDLFKGKAFNSGNYSVHEKALSMYYDAMDDLLLGACIWDYSADNTWRWGDSWNNEDFSIVTTGDGKLPLQPRAAKGWLRPYPLATAGTPLLFKWDVKKKKLYFRYKAYPALNVPTELFIPDTICGTNMKISAGPVQPAENCNIQTEYKPEAQRIFVYHNGYDGEVEITASEK